MSNLVEIIAGAVGQVTSGAGNIVGSLSQGTASCGAKPVCLWTKSCKERRQAYQDCVSRSLDIQQASLNQGPGNKNLDAPASNNSTLIIGAVVVLVLLFIAFKIFKK